MYLYHPLSVKLFWNSRTFVTLPKSFTTLSLSTAIKGKYERVSNKCTSISRSWQGTLNNFFLIYSVFTFSFYAPKYYIAKLYPHGDFVRSLGHYSEHLKYLGSYNPTDSLIIFAKFQVIQTKHVFGLNFYSNPYA